MKGLPRFMNYFENSINSKLKLKSSFYLGGMVEEKLRFTIVVTIHVWKIISRRCCVVMCLVAQCELTLPKESACFHSLHRQEEGNTLCSLFTSRVMRLIPGIAALMGGCECGCKIRPRRCGHCSYNTRDDDTEKFYLLYIEGIFLTANESEEGTFSTLKNKMSPKVSNLI